MSHFSLKFNIYHGFDELERLGEVTCKLGDIACVVLDPFFSGGPLQDRLSSILKNLVYLSFSSAISNLIRTVLMWIDVLLYPVNEVVRYHRSGRWQQYRCCKGDSTDDG